MLDTICNILLKFTPLIKQAVQQILNVIPWKILVNDALLAKIPSSIQEFPQDEIVESVGMGPSTLVVHVLEYLYLSIF